MSDHHFISYSSVDGLDFVLSLCDKLAAGPPSFPVWLDKRELQAGEDWDAQIPEAIKTCASLVFLMTRDSVEDESVCKNEWTSALRYKKPIVPLKLHPDAELPFRLNSRQYIDFSGAFEPALARLRDHLQWLASPAGTLRALKDRLADARRDLQRADPTQQARIQDEIALLAQQIAHQEQVVADPQAAAQRVEQSIARGLERERQPERPIAGLARSKFINPPPGAAPAYFQDRHVESGLIGGFLQNDALRMQTVVGRGGIGKTAMVCRLLKALENGHLPDDGGPLSVDGIVYLSAIGSRRVTMPNLYADLSKLLPDTIATQLDALYKNPQASTEAKMQALLEAFPNGHMIVLLDNFENVIDPETLNVSDAELEEALRALLNAPQHAVKVILTTRIAPRDLMLVQPGRQTRLDLDEGLPSPDAENILRAMDVDGKVGLKDASPAALSEARERTRGYPRALEALFAILSADRDTSLQDILDNTAKLLPENVVQALVGEAFSRLDPVAQQVMQALAIYPFPVTRVAVDYLLQPYVPGVNSALLLGRLVNMQFARKEAGRYYLHPVDRAYALARVPRGAQSDRDVTGAPPFTQLALLHRAADYFQQARTPRESWKKLDDLGPQLAEFELRCAGQEYDIAARVLLEIDYDYLLLWGHYRLMAELHEQLQNKLDDPDLKQASLGNLGTCYYWLGQTERAIDYGEQGLVIAREIGNRQAEGNYLGGLGTCYDSLGQTTRAIDYHEQGLVIAREIGNRQGEGRHLGCLGFCYDSLGQTARAIDYYEQALAIAREIGDRPREGNHLGNLGFCYAALGQTVRAIDYSEQALEITREISYRQGEGTHLSSLAEALIDEGRYAEAVQYALESISIGDEIGSPFHGSYGNGNLALARLFSDDLAGARAAAEAARRYDEPQNNHYVLALLGLIALRQGDRSAAQAAFAAALAQADAMLAHTAQGYSALDSKALALCGLAVCEGGQHVPEAIAAYQAARAINKDAGVVGRVLRLFDALALADAAGVLAAVRAAVEGA